MIQQQIAILASHRAHKGTQWPVAPKRRKRLQGRSLEETYTFLIVYGGEGGIRTPDTLTSMPDFESGAFNRALPPLRP